MLETSLSPVGQNRVSNPGLSFLVAPEKPCLEVASLEDNLAEVWERNLLPQTVSLVTSRWFSMPFSSGVFL